jgi:hypothetical protein
MPAHEVETRREAKEHHPIGEGSMPEKERLYHNLAMVRETIKFEWQDVRSKPLSDSQRAAMRTHVEACIADLRSLLERL